MFIPIFFFELAFRQLLPPSDFFNYVIKFGIYYFFIKKNFSVIQFRFLVILEILSIS